MTRKIAPENWIDMIDGPSVELSIAVASIDEVIYYLSNFIFFCKVSSKRWYTAVVDRRLTIIQWQQRDWDTASKAKSSLGTAWWWCGQDVAAVILTTVDSATVPGNDAKKGDNTKENYSENRNAEETANKGGSQKNGAGSGETECWAG